MSLSKKEILESCRRAEPVVKKWAENGKHVRLGSNGPSEGWYEYPEGYGGDVRRPRLLTGDYRKLAKKAGDGARSIYGTITIINPENGFIQQKELGQVWRKEEEDDNPVQRNPLPEYEDIKSVTLFADVDLESDYKPKRKEEEVKEKVEKAIPIYVRELRKLAPNSVNVLDSGGGFYPHIHHSVTKPISEEFEGEARGWIFDELMGRFNERLGKIGETVKDEVIGASEILDPDALNNKNRLMKAPLSIHRSLDIVVHPIDPDNPDFDPEPAPVTKKVVKETEEWLKTRDSNPEDIETLISELWPEYEGSWEERLQAWYEDEKEKREKREKERLAHKRKMEERRGELGEKGVSIQGFPITNRFDDILSVLETIDMRDMVSSHITDERDGQKPRFDPPWRESETGTSCFATREKFIDINEGNTGGGPAKFVARESGLISSCKEDLKGGEWWEAVQLLRGEYGYKIPILIPDTDTEMPNEDGKTYDRTPHWAVGKAGRAFGIIDDDDFIEIKKESEGDEDEEETETKIIFPITQKWKKYNKILDELDSRGLNHNREKIKGIEVVEEAMEALDYDPNKLGKIWNNEKQKTYHFSVSQTLGFVSSTKEALNKLRRERISAKFRKSKKNNIDKPERKRVIAEAAILDMKNKGKLLKGETGGKFYYYEKEKQVYRTSELDGLLQRLYDISSTTKVGKITKERIKTETENNGEEVKVKKLWLWDDEEKKLYVYNKNKYYFILDGGGIKKRPNGTDGVYFLFDTPENPIKYLPKEERDTDFEIPGKTSDNFKAGDCEVNELLANQTNFASTTNLTAEQQKLQLLLHCYTFPFSELIPAKPIMLFTGEKGSTKSFTFKKIGRFFMDPEYRTRPLPSEDDFYVAVTKYPFTFLDNVESKPHWLEDALARVATEVEIAKRMLYENWKEAKRKPDTFLGLTAREINFNRDDVMDRSLLFHARRIPEGSFLRENDLEKPLRENRHTLWSQYLDNLNKIVEKLKQGGLEGRQSNHRLADWACLAIEIAEALGYDEHYNIDGIFEKMETERAAYTLRDSPVYQTIKQAKAGGILKHNVWQPANEVVRQLQDANEHFAKNAKTVGRELNSHEKEYGEIFDLKIKQQRNMKAYYFPSPDSENKETGECEECGLAEGVERKIENGETRILCESCYEELGYSAPSQSENEPEVEQLGA